MPSAESLANARAAVFGLTGGVCLAYAVAALAIGRPDPAPFWIPGACGLLAGLTMTALSRIAGRATASRAWDEGYRSDASRAAVIAFWVAVMLYPVFGILRAAGLVDADLTFVAMGLLTPATYLLLLTWFELRGRAER